MQAVKGYYSNGKFTPSENVSLPSQIEAVLVFGEPVLQYSPTATKSIEVSDKKKRMDWLNRIEAALELARDEDLSEFPEQGSMKPPQDYAWFN